MKSNSLFTVLLLILGAILSLQSCQEDDEQIPIDPAAEDLQQIISTSNSTFEIIQRLTLDKSCATSGCHLSATSSNGDLNLSKDASYQSLINADITKSPLANDRGFKLVTPNEVSKSFLITKINCFGEETPDHHDYGFPMPLGRPALAKGEIDFIIEWIEAGAPETGHVVNTDILNDETLGCAEIVENFIVPAPPARGYQITSGPFPVQPGKEREIFIYKKLDNTEAIFINKVEMFNRPYAHHLLTYLPKDLNNQPEENLIREIDQFSDLFGITLSNDLMTTTQLPNDILTFPEGVALKIEPNTGIDINSHYANYTGEEITGEVFLNIHTVEDESTIEHLAQPVFLGETSSFGFMFTVPALSEYVIDKQYTVSDETAHIINLVSHTHKLGTTFEMYHVKSDGSQVKIYNNADWEHPEVSYFDPPLVIQPDEKIRTVAKYYNPTNEDVVGGVKSTNEMHLILGYYY